MARKPPVVAGLDAAAIRHITAVEHAHYEPGAVARALAQWRAHVHGPARDLAEPDNLLCYCCPDDHATTQRTLLDSVLRQLPRRSARALGALIRPLDETFLRRTYLDSTSDPAMVWWARRLPR